MQCHCDAFLSVTSCLFPLYPAISCSDSLPADGHLPNRSSSVPMPYRDHWSIHSGYYTAQNTDTTEAPLIQGDPLVIPQIPGSQSGNMLFLPHIFFDHVFHRSVLWLLDYSCPAADTLQKTILFHLRKIPPDCRHTDIECFAKLFCPDILFFT